MFPQNADWKNNQNDPYLKAGKAIQKPNMGYSDKKTGIKSENVSKSKNGYNTTKSELNSALGMKPKGNFHGKK